jgi:AAA15 family ATPase/GTPase
MNQVFDRLQISGYRGFNMLDLPQLGQVNIFVGNNNSGKTSILEAISILCNPLDPFQWLEVAQRRLYLGRSIAVRPNIQSLKWVFPQNISTSSNEFYQSEISIKASGRYPILEIKASLGEIYGSSVEKNNRQRLSEDISSTENDSILSGIEIEVEASIRKLPMNLFNSNIELSNKSFQFWENERFVQRRKNKPFVNHATVFPSYSSSDPILNSLTQIILKEEDGKNELVKLIQSFDDNIIDLIILAPTDIAVLYVKHKELGIAPLYIFGDGLKRTLVIALILLTTKNGLLLIDEIETSIHVSALSRVFSWLVQTCYKREIQLFVTTHSLEAIDAMLSTDIEENIVAFRLNSKGQPPQRFSSNLLHRLRSERGLDVR